MSHATNTPGITTLPDAPRASEAATTASTKRAEAQSLVRGEDVRTAAAKALVHTATRPGTIASGSPGSDASDTTDDDTGTTLATDAVASARGAAALNHRLRRLRRRQTADTGDTAGDSGGDTDTSDGYDNGIDTGADTTVDTGTPAGDGATYGSASASAPTGSDTQDGTARPASRASHTSHTLHASPMAPASAPGTATPTDPSTPPTSASHRHSGALDVTPRPTTATDTLVSTAASKTATEAPVHAARGAHDLHGLHNRHDIHDHQDLGPDTRSHRQAKATTNGSRNAAPKDAATPTNRTNHALRKNRRRMIERRRVATMARRPPVMGTSIASAPTAAATNTATPATMAVAAPIVVCALVLWAVFMMLMTLIVGGASDEERLVGARRVADVAREAYETGARRGDYHWKGQLFRDYVGGTTGPWDAAFCSWCLGQAGFIESGLVGRYASVDSFLARFEFDEDAGEVHTPDDLSYVPEVGDLLVLWAGADAARIEVVTAVTDDGQTVTTVSGDAAGGEAGSYDRDADGYGGYVAATERTAHAAHGIYLHPHYATGSTSTSP